MAVEATATSLGLLPSSRPRDRVVRVVRVIIVIAIIAKIHPSNRIDRYQLEVVIKRRASVSLQRYLVANLAAQPP